MNRRLFIGFLLWMSALVLFAEEISFTCKAPSTVVSGQQFKLVYTINKEGKDLRVPEISDFDVLFGPSTSHSSSFQIVNGKATSTTQITYTYMLAGKEPGKYTIAPATIVVKGDKYTSNSVKIEVLPADKTNNSSSSATTSQGLPVDNSSVNVNNEQIFVKQHFSKTKVYEQEAIQVTYKLYTRLDVVQVGGAKFPEFKDFYVQDIELDPNRSWTIEHLDGYNYNTIVLKQCIIFPQHAGKIDIDGGNVEVVLRMRTSSSRQGSIFDDFFQSYQDVKKNLKFSGAQINVKELPAGAPAGFNGAVGAFTLNSSVSSDNIKVNDALTLKLKIAGTGNLKLIKTPEVKFPQDFDVYDPKQDVKVKPVSNGQNGSKSIEYVAIPRFGGEFEIPAVKFVYFDINRGSYQTLSTPVYKINVDGSAESASTTGTVVVPSMINKENVKQLASDIRFIHTDIERALSKKNTHFAFSSSMYVCLLTPLFIFIIVLLLLQKQARENANVALRNTKRANKVAKKRLKEAQKCLKAGDKSKFYEETMRALWGYIADKLTIPVSELTKDNVQEKLVEHNCDESLVKEFLACLSDCEFARFSPVVDESMSMENIYSRAAELIGKLDNTLR